jgi:hypothetical protein
MSHYLKGFMYRKVLFILIGFVSKLTTQAQETSGYLTEEGTGGRWYASPWIWVIGAALFILALVALSRNKKD